MNVIKVYDDGITNMKKFTGTSTGISLKNHHIQGCSVYVLDTILQINIAGLPKW